MIKLNEIRIEIPYIKHFVISIGSGEAQQYLQKIYSSFLILKEAVSKALETLKQVMEEKLSYTNVTVVKVTPKDLFYMYFSYRRCRDTVWQIQKRVENSKSLCNSYSTWQKKF